VPGGREERGGEEEGSRKLIAGFVRFERRREKRLTKRRRSDAAAMREVDGGGRGTWMGGCEFKRQSLRGIALPFKDVERWDRNCLFFAGFGAKVGDGNV